MLRKTDTPKRRWEQRKTAYVQKCVVALYFVF